MPAVPSNCLSDTCSHNVVFRYRLNAQTDDKGCSAIFLIYCDGSQYGYKHNYDMKTQNHLLDNFIRALHRKIGKRSELVYFISETLNIERKAASRRLNKKVHFGIDEMEILSVKTGISIDSLMSSKKNPPFTLCSPMSINSMNILIEDIKKRLDNLNNLSGDDIECGSIFTFPPIEFLIPYKNLLKLAYFKWGYFHINSTEFSDFSSWNIPDKLFALNADITDAHSRLSHICYIWDPVCIWSLAKDINFFLSTNILDSKHAELLKNDLHTMLNDMEKLAGNGTYSYYNKQKKIEFFVSSIFLGGNFIYYVTNNKEYSAYRTSFLSSDKLNDIDQGVQVKAWIDSMKKISTPITQCGIKERKIFFNEQHAIVDTLIISSQHQS